MAKIPPMTLEEFFELAQAHVAMGRPTHAGRGDLSFSIRPNLEEGGGYVGSIGSHVVRGDTPGETVRAAFDCFTVTESRRTRLNPPYFTSDREAGNWDKCARHSYDYRAVDFKPPASL